MQIGISERSKRNIVVSRENDMHAKEPKSLSDSESVQLVLFGIKVRKYGVNTVKHGHYPKKQKANCFS